MIVLECSFEMQTFSQSCQFVLGKLRQGAERFFANRCGPMELKPMLSGPK